jgi:hypothetical protein
MQASKLISRGFVPGPAACLLLAPAACLPPVSAIADEIDQREPSVDAKLA